MECDLKNESCGTKCTGYDGKDVWAKLHKLPKEIDCETCADHADSLFKGLHDTVNIGLGKKPYDATNFNAFVKEINCAHARCKQEGRC